MGHKHFIYSCIFLLLFPNLGFSKVGVALFATTSESYYRDTARNGIVLPLINFTFGPVSISGRGITYTPIKSKVFTFNINSTHSFFNAGYDPDEDSTYLTGMDQRRGTLYLGTGSRIKLGPIKFNLSYSQDVLGVHGEYTAGITTSTGFPISLLLKFLPTTILSVSYGLNFYSESYVNYYFGVETKEVRTNRPSYTTTSTVTNNLGLSLRIIPGKNSMINFSYTKEKLSDEIKDSPLVVREDVDSYMSLFTYKF